MLIDVWFAISSELNDEKQKVSYALLNFNHNSDLLCYEKYYFNRVADEYLYNWAGVALQ